MRVRGRSRRLVVSIGLVLALLAAAGCDWSQAGFDPSHSGFNPSEPTLTASSASRLGLAWFCDQCSTFYSSDVVVSNGTVFGPGSASLHSNEIIALDAATGATKWTHSTLPNARAVAVANGLVYVTVNVYSNASIEALDQTTGVLRWSVPAPAPPATAIASVVAAMSGGLAFVLGRSGPGIEGPFVGGLAALDSAGNTVWSVTPGGDITDVAVVGGEVTALRSETLAVAPFVRTSLTTYSAADGHVIRSVSLALTDGSGHPLTPDQRLSVQNGVAYFTATDDPQSAQHLRGLFAVDTTTGALKWSVVPEDVSGFVLVGGSLLSVRTHGGTGALVARDATTGTVRWSADVPSSTQGSVSLTAAGGLAYVAGAGIDVYAVTDGSHVGRFAPPAAYASSAIPSEGHVYALFPAGLLALKPTP